jgi:hypothetical protein
VWSTHIPLPKRNVQALNILEENVKFACSFSKLFYIFSNILGRGKKFGGHNFFVKFFDESSREVAFM